MIRPIMENNTDTYCSRCRQLVKSVRGRLYYHCCRCGYLLADEEVKKPDQTIVAEETVASDDTVSR